jgi:hypothetical protein
MPQSAEESELLASGPRVRSRLRLASLTRCGALFVALWRSIRREQSSAHDKWQPGDGRVYLLAVARLWRMSLRAGRVSTPAQHKRQSLMADCHGSCVSSAVVRTV